MFVQNDIEEIRKNIFSLQAGEKLIFVLPNDDKQGDKLLNEIKNSEEMKCKKYNLQTKRSDSNRIINVQINVTK